MNGRGIESALYAQSASLQILLENRIASSEWVEGHALRVYPIYRSEVFPFFNPQLLSIPCKNRLKHMPRHPWILLQPPDRIAIPIATEGNADAQTMTLRNNFAALRIAYTQEHLELVSLACDPALGKYLSRTVDQHIVMCCDTDIAAVVQYNAQALQVVLLNLFAPLERN